MMNEGTYQVRLETVEDVDQYSERFAVQHAGGEEMLRVHDYERIYQLPGLYEQVVVDLLQCVSHTVAPALLAHTVEEAGSSMAALNILDFGAGIGLVGAELKERGASRIIGLDIVPSARAAAQRDHPGVYDDYLIEDICNLSPPAKQQLRDTKINCLVCVSALGLRQHVSADIFRCAFAAVPIGSWVAFNLNTTFLEPGDETGYAALLDTLSNQQCLNILDQHAYQHRILMDGTPVPCTAFIGRKTGELAPT